MDMMAIVTNMKDENEALGIARTLMNKVITKKKYWIIVTLNLKNSKR
ncbi:hypothetical protein IMAU10228_02856 [Lactiplantibacillus plantarum]|nr:hypothetical protein [Lactiplantibacillus plantarum]